MIEERTQAADEWRDWRLAAALGTIAALGALVRWSTVTDFPDHVDSLLFARGVERYSVAQSRPHFPGYPLYIWGARLARVLVGDPLRALHLTSVVCAALTSVPLGLLAAAWRRAMGGRPAEWRGVGTAAALLWNVLPLSWITASEASSDAMGALLGITMLWCATHAAEGRVRWAWATGVIGGLLPGARLADVTLLTVLPIVVAAAPRRRAVGLALAGGLLAGVTPWVAWQLSRDGWTLVAAGRAHVMGHFLDWGGSTLTDAHRASRLSRAARTFFLYGIGGWVPGSTAIRAGVSIVLGTLFARGVRELARTGARTPALALAFIVPYAVYVTLGHDVREARYHLPVVAMVALVAALGAGVSMWGRAALVLAIVLAAGVTVPLALEHRRVPPTEVQLARHFARLDPTRNALIAPDTRGPLLLFLAEWVPTLPVVMAEGEAMEAYVGRFGAQGRTAYAVMPDPSRPERWRPVTRFCRAIETDPRSEPQIWLFRREGGGAVDAALPGCAPAP